MTGVVELLGALALGGAGSCPATTVHYGATSIGVPWVASNGVVGHVFAYGGRTLMDERDKRVRRARLLHPRPHAGGQFPSIVDVPAAGCWRLTVRTGKLRASFVLEAVDAQTEPVCEPTTVFRDTPHPRFGAITWMPATPRSSGIAAVLFVSTVPGAERALIYAGGHAPEGWNAKFLWWSPRPGGRVVLVGRRMDAPGSFQQADWGGYGVTPLVTGPIFPSIVEIPTPGCWAVTVSIGARSGLVVFQAVPPG